MERAAAKIEHEWNEIARLAGAYPDAFKAIAKQMGLVEAKDRAEPSSGIVTMRDLIVRYRTSPASPVHNLKHATRSHYDTLMDLISADYAGQILSEANAETLDQMYAKWREGGKIASAQSKMVMLRNLFGFGTTLVRDEDCARLYGLVGKMQIELPKPRTERMTADQAKLIRYKAREKGRASIAIAQAFQFDLGLTQKSAIGEWLPMSEPGISDVIDGNLKWMRGIRWEDIDQNNLTLKYQDGDNEIVADLKKHQMIMEELRHVRALHHGALPTKGPVVVSEYSNRPWEAVEFRRWWRRIANECGLPKTIRNSDARIRHATASIDDDESEGEPAFESEN